ncbi:MAG: hypothetical protein HY875_06775 [Chloroflexi bacterium]|nr:hypothetical protein [Chloroflexota bacterium]
MAVLVGACGGDTPDAPLPQVHEARAERLVIDGAPGLASRVDIRFSRAFPLAETRIPLASHFEVEIPESSSPGSRTGRMLVQTATAADDRLSIQLQVAAVVPAGSVVHIARKAFRGGETGEITATVAGDLSPEVAILASQALVAGRAGVLDPAQVATPTADDDDPVAMRAALERHLAARGSAADTVGRALERFDAIPVSIVPAPKLRAALAALTGTFAEPALDSLFTAQNCTAKVAGAILFQPPPDEPQLLARATRDRQGRRVISVNPALRGDRIEHLMPILAHEAIHCDNEDSPAEEVAATAFDTFLYLQLVAAIPDLVATNTPLARDLNVDVIAMINSGRMVPESAGVLRSPGVTRALPGTGATAASFADLVAAAYPGLEGQSPAEALAEAYVARVAPVAGMAPGTAFDLRYLDELIGRATSPELMVAVLVVFEMGPGR